MLSEMEHVRSGPLGDRFYISLRNSIHMFRPDAAERIFHMVAVAMGFKVGRQENPIIRMIFVDAETLILSERLKLHGAFDCFTGGVGLLWEVEYLAAGMVNKKTAARVASTFSTKTTWQTSLNR